ncbi:ATP-binding protein [Mesobacillus jeotgali]|uniref:histidine kinase n=1 Tax=Mesobacillus jeotgali TaxID=129985 RepID=A0ABY9VU49_9BACI|nr:ATP-binding protein [Mesobacillus jeotgali]WNF25292.1 ATP-binding protein [Mesobacillus jeotgali]
MRFGDRLQWNVSVPAKYEHVRIPKLIIQPLVENAILHGAGNKAGNSQISVTVEPVTNKDEERIRISVKDDGSGMDPVRLSKIIQSMESGGTTSANGKGMAISNVYKRLKLYYQGISHPDLLIESELDQGTLITFELPVRGGD